MPTPSAQEAMRILRDPSFFQWYVVPFLAMVIYVYNVEIEKRNWNAVFAGLAFWGMDWFNEIWNGLLFHFTQYAPAWGAPGKSAFLILIGLNIEICFMFAIAGIIMSKMLLPDKNAKILGINNRYFIAISGSIFCVIVEYFLNMAGALTWDWAYWSRTAPWLIFFIGYLPFYLVAFWVYDMESIRKKIITVGTIFAFDAICLIVFAGILKWI